MPHWPEFSRLREGPFGGPYSAPCRGLEHAHHWVYEVQASLCLSVPLSSGWGCSVAFRGTSIVPRQGCFLRVARTSECRDTL